MKNNNASFTVNLVDISSYLRGRLSHFSKVAGQHVVLPAFLFDERFLSTVSMMALEQGAKRHLRWFNGNLTYDKNILGHGTKLPATTSYEMEFREFANKIMGKPINTLGDVWHEAFGWFMGDDVVPDASPYTLEELAAAKLKLDQAEITLGLHLANGHEEAAHNSREFQAYQATSALVGTLKQQYLRGKSSVTTFSSMINDSQVGHFKSYEYFLTYLFFTTVEEPLMQIIDTMIIPIVEGDEWDYWMVKQYNNLAAKYECRGNWLYLRALELMENGHEDLFLC